MTEENLLNAQEFTASFPVLQTADGKRAFRLAQAAEWVVVTTDGYIRLAEKGHKIRRLTTPADALRTQLYDIILKFRPAWTSLIPRGRAEASRYLPPEVLQAISEAELMGGDEEAVVAWWDSAANAARGFEQSAKLEIGREGEKLSIAHEASRTGRQPKWQSLESNLCGYDLISVTSASETRRLLIEVKACLALEEDARFHISRNQWEVATGRIAYVFHVWVLRPEPKLMVMKVEDLRPHLPVEQGAGRWESVVVRLRDLPESLIGIERS